jgi:catechol 2,3-dioxygenase-like lactoylglutathione lyase family enzyme
MSTPTTVPAPDLTAGTLRVARPTNNIQALLPFYKDGLGFDVLAEFKDHEGFHGIVLGRAGAPYHIEFTTKEGHETGRSPSEDNLLVFYLPEKAEWDAAVARMERAGHVAVAAFNPYWDRVGKTYEDPDGYRVVFQNAAWKL